MNTTKHIRLNKRLVELGLADSRRAADALISSGAVSVNGQIALNLATQVIDSDSIKAAGKLGHEKNDITILFNKPIGYVCTHKAQGEQKTIYSLLPKSFSQLKCIGRLDKDSQGLLILTSNGNLVQQLSHPSRKKEKEYIVSTARPLNSGDLKKLRQGIQLVDGVSRFELVKPLNPKTLRLVLTSGRNRQIRRSFEAIGHTVVKLERVRIKDYKLDTLAIGKYKFIEPTKEFL